MSVRCDGRLVGRSTLSAAPGSWQTLHVPVTLASTETRLELQVENPLLCEQSGERLDYGLRVNEISVLPDASPFLRPATMIAAA